MYVQLSALVVSPLIISHFYDLKAPILVGAAAAEASKPAAPCPAIDDSQIDPATLMPKTGWKLVFSTTTQGAASRNYTCGADGTILGAGTLTAGDTTGAVYDTSFIAPYGTLGVANIYTAGTNKTQTLGQYYIDTPGVEFPGATPNDIPWNRRTIFMITGDTLPYATIRTRINTSGGVPTTTTCDTPGAWVQVPFTADYGWWTCE